MKSNPLKFKLQIQLFAEDDPEDKTKKDPEDPTKKYLDEIERQKAEVKAKDEELRKAHEENKTLLNRILDGDLGPDDKDPDEKDPKTVSELRDELFKPKKDLNNLQFAEKTLALRDKIMEEGGIDPFLPQGSKVRITAEDREAAQRVAECMKHCIEIADGDSEIYTRELMRITTDVMPEARKPGA
jgi:hypothetical protein